MAKRKISEIEPGMVLLDDIFDESGRLMIGSETVLSENHIEFLKRNLIDEVTIRSEEDLNVALKTC